MFATDNCCVRYQRGFSLLSYTAMEKKTMRLLEIFSISLGVLLDLIILNVDKMLIVVLSCNFHSR